MCCMNAYLVDLAQSVYYIFIWVQQQFKKLWDTQQVVKRVKEELHLEVRKGMNSNQMIEIRRQGYSSTFPGPKCPLSSVRKRPS